MLGALLTEVITTFCEISRKRWFFDTPFNLIKEKKFHLLEGTMNFFENLKGQKWKKPLNISKKDFYKQVLEFHRPSKFIPDICASKSLVPVALKLSILSVMRKAENRQDHVLQGV